MDVGEVGIIVFGQNIDVGVDSLSKHYEVFYDIHEIGSSHLMATLVVQ